MKRINLLTSLLALALLVAVGCVSMQPLTPPDGCEDSLIYERIPNPRMVKAALFLANAAALRKGLYDADEVLVVLDGLGGLLAQDLTYAGLLMRMIPVINRLNKDAGFIVIGLSPAIRGLDAPIPISDCDIGILQGLVAEMRATVVALDGVGG